MTDLIFASNPGQVVELPTIEEARAWCTANGGSSGCATFWVVTWPFVEPRIREREAAA